MADDETLRLVAIDPGDVHVGWAVFIGLVESDVEELTPAECLIRMEQLLTSQAIDVLVIESFQLYPWEAENQYWSTFPTCELIGALKWLHAKHGYGCELVMQKADIKKPTFAQLRARGIKSLAKRRKVPGQHVLDAEAHAWHYLLRRYA